MNPVLETNKPVDEMKEEEINFTADLEKQEWFKKIIGRKKLMDKFVMYWWLE